MHGIALDGLLSSLLVAEYSEGEPGIITDAGDALATGGGVHRQRALTPDGVDRWELLTVGTGHWRQAGNAPLGSNRGVEGRQPAGAGFEGSLQAVEDPGGPRGENQGVQGGDREAGAEDRLRAGLVHNRQAPEGGSAKMKRETHARAARSPQRVVVSPCATRGVVER